MSAEELLVLAEEQAALRRVATLVARGVAPEEVFAAVTEEAGRLLSVEYAGLNRYEPDGTTMTIVAVWGRTGDPVPPGGHRQTLGGNNVSTRVFETGRAARIDVYADASGLLGAGAREYGIGSGVGTPVIVEGRLWGVMSVYSALGQPLPPNTEPRLASFTELLATAIANAESRAGLARLAAEQAALRRVATLVARGSPPEELFAAVTDEVALVLPVGLASLARYEPDGTMTVVATSGPVGDRFPVGGRWPLGGKNVSTIVAQTGRPARIDDYDTASGAVGVAVRGRGLRSSVGTPILVEGRQWGVMTASSVDHPLPADTEERLASFTELLATAIANAESGAGLAELAAEQAALRRVATLVAHGVPSDEVFAAVTEEAGRLLSVDRATLGRYESDGTMTVVVAWSETGDFSPPVGSRQTLGGNNVSTRVFETGRPARVDSYVDASGPLGVAAREDGISSGVGTPVIVEGDLWGVMATYATLGRPLPAETEARLASFTELLATAIANAETGAGLAQLAAEQAALRRVAMLVAGGAPPDEVFAAVALEVGRLLAVASVGMGRYEPDGAVTSVAAWGLAATRFPVGSRWVPEGKNLVTIVFETGRPARIDNYAAASGPLGVAAREMGFRSAVATPIIVEGRLWGVVISASSDEQPLPADTEARLASFTGLLATAIANAESGAGLARLAAEQAALRRVATLVAGGVPPDEVFAAVALEVGQLLAVAHVGMGRYEPDGTVISVASWGMPPARPVGTRWTRGARELATIVAQTGHSGRLDNYADASETEGAAGRGRGVRSGVATPIIVEGRLWGVMAAGSLLVQPLPADTEARLASFTELVATAIANAESRADLAASRARIVAAADETRRRIERDLHDGTQQHLVSLMLDLREVQATQPSDVGELQARLAGTERGLAGVLEELQEISRGIHPAILSKGGLDRALRALARRSAVRVELDLHAERRLPEPVEVAAYYVVSEALTNVAKHAHASVVNVELDTHDATLQVTIRDDGIGGADPKNGSGLVGLGDRIQALGGTLQLTSTAGGGTTVLVELPVEGQSSAGPPEP